jgi:hypothetical protein
MEKCFRRSIAGIPAFSCIVVLLFGVCVVFTAGVCSAQEPEKEKITMASAQEWQSVVDEGSPANGCGDFCSFGYPSGMIITACGCHGPTFNSFPLNLCASGLADAISAPCQCGVCDGGRPPYLIRCH